MNVVEINNLMKKKNIPLTVVDYKSSKTYLELNQQSGVYGKNLVARGKMIINYSQIEKDQLMNHLLWNPKEGSESHVTAIKNYVQMIETVNAEYKIISVHIKNPESDNPLLYLMGNLIKSENNNTDDFKDY